LLKSLDALGFQADMNFLDNYCQVRCQKTHARDCSRGFRPLPFLQEHTAQRICTRKSISIGAPATEFADYCGLLFVALVMLVLLARRGL
jgi:hypothetical protein